MERRKFTREFKLEAVRLITERGVSYAQAEQERCKPDALPHHFDRGSQYSSEQFQRLMADHDVICSTIR